VWVKCVFGKEVEFSFVFVRKKINSFGGEEYNYVIRGKLSI
jgi:hypothetical protein